MVNQAFEDIVDDFDLLDGWEERYRYIIELGRAMEPLESAMKVPATKVEGCASQVWLYHTIKDGCMYVFGESDAMIVNGLIAVLTKLYNGCAPNEVAAIDARAEMGRLGLNDHLSTQRSNGLNAMIIRIKGIAERLSH
ncbi:MAG: SufE family protein [Aestuariivita sp.]|nr:SufE family protein [Aestuariivita sp.]